MIFELVRQAIERSSAGPEIDDLPARKLIATLESTDVSIVKASKPLVLPHLFSGDEYVYWKRIQQRHAFDFGWPLQRGRQGHDATM
ncbi:MAG: hypothetical protein P8Z76_20080 [Alphaproteobacteria bacterium]